jgi:hypothetical protein
MSEEKELKPEETFDGAFAEAVGGEVKGKEEAAEVTEPKAEGESKSEDKEGEAKKEEDVKGKEGEVKPEPSPKTPPKVGDFEQKYKTLQGMFESEAKRRMALEEEINKLKEPKPDLKIEPKPEPLDEEDPELIKYLEEYDIVAKNEAKLRKKEQNVLIESIITKIREEFGATQEQVQRFLKEKETNEEMEHAVSILDAHEDYGVDFDRPEIEAWVDSLSGIKHREYKAILEDGNTGEVIDLITKYKEANNIPLKKKEELMPENAPAKTEEEIRADEEKQRKLESMEAVNPKKRPIGGSGTKKAEDFEGAFNEAMEVYEKETAKKK